MIHGSATRPFFILACVDAELKGAWLLSAQISLTLETENAENMMAAVPAVR